MKKIYLIVLILFLIFINCFAINIYSQEYIYENEILYVNHENGVKVENELIFSLSETSYENIKNSNVFIQWQEITFSNPNNEGYINKHKDWDKVILFLNSKIRMSIFHIRMKIKNPNSLEFIDKSKGNIYLNNKNEIIISYNFKCQNLYGNFIINQCIYSVFLKNNEIKSEIILN